MVDEGYIAEMRELVPEQAKRAGVRLAKLLNEALAKSWADVRSRQNHPPSFIPPAAGTDYRRR